MIKELLLKESVLILCFLSQFSIVLVNFNKSFIAIYLLLRIVFLFGCIYIVTGSYLCRTVCNPWLFLFKVLSSAICCYFNVEKDVYGEISQVSDALCG